MTEAAIYEALARYINLQYPGLVYHFDLSGVNNPSKYSRAMYSRLNGRAYPDLFVAVTMLIPGTVSAYHGLFIEIKREGTRLVKRDGTWADKHVEEQAAMLDALNREGYAAVFGVGLDQCIEIIDAYMKGTMRVINDSAWNTLTTSTISDKQQGTQRRSELPSSPTAWSPSISQDMKRSSPKPTKHTDTTIF